MTRALVLVEPRRFEVAEWALPHPGRAEAVVRIGATAVCHTDLSIYAGHHPGVNYPVVLGHEAAGIVEEVGPDTRIAVGTRVVIDPVIACGTCDCCARGDANLCRRAGLFGREINGSLAERVVLPERYLHALPPDLGLETATIIETLATVRHAQRRVRIAPGDTVVVLGQGTSGLLHTRLAKLSGATPLIAVEPTEWKLERAQRMGADVRIDPLMRDPVNGVLDATGGRGADLVIDAAGEPSLVRPMMDMLRPGGTLLFYAIGHDVVPDFTIFPMYLKELTLVGSRALSTGDFEPSIRLVASGALDLDGFVTRSYPLDQTATAFADYERDPASVLRIVIGS